MFITKRDWHRMDRVEIKNLERYLRATGWMSDESGDDQRRRRWERYGFSVDTPAWTGFTDYARRIGDVVQTLARVEDRYPDAVLDDLLEDLT